jgi:26S proteasome regulatory subunit N2
MAIGFSHSASGDPEAIFMLQPLLSDAVDFVRQGALLASALVLMQQSNAQVQTLSDFRLRIAELVKDKYPAVLTKIGAIVAAGIIDAGGRNCAVTLKSSGGFLKHSACAGLALWAQSWYWYPMFHFFSLALTPTLLIGLNSNFEMPSDFSTLCSASAGLFAYPPQTIEKQEAKKERVATVILSTTLKHQVREKAKDRQNASFLTPENSVQRALARLQQEPQEPQEPVLHEGLVKLPLSKLPNPSRVTQMQVGSCAFDLQQRFVPVATTIKPSGVVILADQEPGLPQKITKFNDFCQVQNEAGLPCPFEWPGTGNRLPI